MTPPFDKAPTSQTHLPHGAGSAEASRQGLPITSPGGLRDELAGVLTRHAPGSVRAQVEAFNVITKMLAMGGYADALDHLDQIMSQKVKR